VTVLRVLNVLLVAISADEHDGLDFLRDAVFADLEVRQAEAGTNARPCRSRGRPLDICVPERNVCGGAGRRRLLLRIQPAVRSAASNTSVSVSTPARPPTPDLRLPTSDFTSDFRPPTSGYGVTVTTNKSYLFLPAFCRKQSSNRQ